MDQRTIGHRSRSLLLTLLLPVALFAGCDGESDGGDATVMDAAGGADDGGGDAAPTPTSDAATVSDAGPDATPSPMDATPAPVDATPALVDATPVPVDAAPEVVDAAPEVVDAAPVVVDAAPGVVDAAPVVVDAAPIPEEICFSGIDIGRVCYPGCGDEADCGEDEMCSLSAGGRVCVPDCAAVGCRPAHVCEEDGHCRIEGRILRIGGECDSQAACEGGQCCQWRRVMGEDLGDPALWQCQPIEAARDRDPEAVGRCDGDCPDCAAALGAMWCDGDVCANSCDGFAPPPAGAPNPGYCRADFDMCWGGDCECVDSQLGFCLRPVR